jgi:hypothetical protein
MSGGPNRWQCATRTAAARHITVTCPAAFQFTPSCPSLLSLPFFPSLPGCLQNKVVGIVGAGRIGSAYARMMVEGHKCDLLYFDPYPNKFLEEYIRYCSGTAGRHGTAACRGAAAWGLSGRCCERRRLTAAPLLLLLCCLPFCLPAGTTASCCRARGSGG